jgi:hypothetical protein
MERNCDRCGNAYEAQRPTSKYCGSTCRARASRLPATADPPDAHDSPLVAAGPVEAACRAELLAAHRIDAAAGRAALALAARIDAGNETGAGLASLSKEFRAALTQALLNAKKAPDALDQLRARRAQRIAAGTD